MVLKTYSFALQTDSFVDEGMRQGKLWVSDYDVCGNVFRNEKAAPMKERGPRIDALYLLNDEGYGRTVHNVSGRSCRDSSDGDVVRSRSRVRDDRGSPSTSATSTTGTAAA